MTTNNISTSGLLLSTVIYHNTTSSSYSTCVNVLTFVLYVVGGLFIFCGNVPIFATVAKFTALNMEKQYVMVAGLAFADGINGIAFIAGGVYRCWVILFGHQHELVTSWECLLCVHNLLWIWTQTFAQLMLLVVSVDRLLSVVFPLRYLALTHSYALRFVTTALGYSLISGVVGIITSYRKPKVAENQKICYTRDAVGGTWYAYYGAVNTLFPFASVIIYVVIGIIIRMYYRNTLAQLQQSNTASRKLKDEAQQQRKMTESLAISCFFTFFLYCFPYGTASVLALTAPELLNSLGAWFFALSMLNPAVNVVIYLVRHREMRIGVNALFTGRHMAPRMDTWLQNARAAQNIASHNHATTN